MTAIHRSHPAGPGSVEYCYEAAATAAEPGSRGEGYGMVALIRRAFISRTGGITATGLALALLAACGLVPRPSPGPASAGGGANSGKCKIPSYVPAQGGPTPDLPARADGVDAG